MIYAIIELKWVAPIHASQDNMIEEPTPLDDTTDHKHAVSVQTTSAIKRARQEAVFVYLEKDESRRRTTPLALNTFRYAQREGVFQALWYLFCSAKLCKTALAVAQINEFFHRCFCVRAGETGSVMLLECHSSLDIDAILKQPTEGDLDRHELTIDQLEEQPELWTDPPHSLLQQDSTSNNRLLPDMNAMDHLSSIIYSAMFRVGRPDFQKRVEFGDVSKFAHVASTDDDAVKIHHLREKYHQKTFESKKKPDGTSRKSGRGGGGPGGGDDEGNGGSGPSFGGGGGHGGGGPSGPSSGGGGGNDGRRPSGPSSGPGGGIDGGGHSGPSSGGGGGNDDGGPTGPSSGEGIIAAGSGPSGPAYDDIGGGRDLGGDYFDHGEGAGEADYPTEKCGDGSSGGGPISRKGAGCQNGTEYDPKSVGPGFLAGDVKDKSTSHAVHQVADAESPRATSAFGFTDEDGPELWQREEDLASAGSDIPSEKRE